jgi:hypothetical protein
MYANVPRNTSKSIISSFSCSTLDLLQVTFDVVVLVGGHLIGMQATKHIAYEILGGIVELFAKLRLFDEIIPPMSTAPSARLGQCVNSSRAREREIKRVCSHRLKVNAFLGLFPKVGPEVHCERITLGLQGLNIPHKVLLVCTIHSSSCNAVLGQCHRLVQSPSKVFSAGQIATVDLLSCALSSPRRITMCKSDGNGLQLNLAHMIRFS